MDSMTSNQMFAVGEIAIAAGDPGNPYFGTDVLIVGPQEFGVVEYVSSGRIAEGWFYRVRTHDGKTWSASNEDLRKKKPPRDDLKVIRWDECSWQPESIHV